MSAPLDLYSNIGEIREALDVLLQRGRPVSVADLQALVAAVEAKSRPTITLSAEKVAQQLVPQLLPLLPTPATLDQAGQQAARRIEASIAAGTQASTQQITASVLESTRQLTAATAALTAAAQQMPRSVPVDFLRGWRHMAGLALGPVVVVLFFLWIGGGFLRGVPGEIRPPATRCSRSGAATGLLPGANSAVPEGHGHDKADA